LEESFKKAFDFLIYSLSLLPKAINIMIYPSISEYAEAIKSAEDNLDSLSSLRPVLDDDGLPVMSSGNFAVVFKMRDENDGSLHAVKCFLRDQPGRDESYQLITNELEYVSSNYLCNIKYLKDELFVDTDSSDQEEFPVVLMDWVEGEPLDAYIRSNISDAYALHMLAYQFCRMTAWLFTQPFAHGDLKPDNILVNADGQLVLVDYDGMYVPAMKGQKARELGSPDYRHPQRTESVFDEHIDDFSIAVIALSLKAIALNPDLLAEYGSADHLLFTESDYRDLSKCTLIDALHPLFTDKELNRLYAIFLIAYSQQELSAISFRLFSLNKPSKEDYEQENLSTKVTDEDLENAWIDEYGAKYSKEGKRLLRVYRNLIYYEIKKGTKVICDGAFSWCKSLQSVSIPESVTAIGMNPFENCRPIIKCYSKNFLVEDNVLYSNDKKRLISFCSKVTHFQIPDSVTEIGKWAFRSCESLQSVSIPESVTEIGDGVFSCCTSLQSVSIPESVTEIGDGAFSWCKSLQSVSIPESVTTIGESAFSCCKSLQSVSVPESVTEIGDGAFDWCESLQSVSIPESVTAIGGNPFKGCRPIIKCYSKNFLVEDNVLYSKDKKRLISFCSEVTHFQIPESVTEIGKSAFSDCDSLQSVSISESVTTIGDQAFSGCTSLQSVSIPESVTEIGNEAFSDCDSLQSVSIPESVTEIGDGAFSWCKSLQSVSIPESVTEIGNRAFDGCTSLQSVSIPESVTEIGNRAFDGCSSLQSVSIPESVTAIGGNPFENCRPIIKCYSKNFLVEDNVLYSKEKKRLISFCSEVTHFQIPESVTHIGEGAFHSCTSLQSVSIPESVTEIGDGAFSDCDSLQSVSIPESVTHIGEGAFKGCTSLQSVSIPKSVTTIGESGFLLVLIPAERVHTRVRN
jgi:serine/threonine protein kinase